MLDTIIRTYHSPIHLDEQETNVNILCNGRGEEDTVTVDTTIMKDYNRLVKLGWERTEVYQYDDGTVCGGRFVGRRNMISFRDANAKKREYSEEERKELAERLARVRNANATGKEDE